MRKILIPVFIFILASFAVSLYFYPSLPTSLASHWDSQGNVNGYSSKFVALFLLPIISIAMVLLFFALPYIDPLKKNYKKFMTYFDFFILVIVLFLFYIHLLTILWNLGFRYNMTLVLVPAFTALCLCLAILTSKAKRNWFVGIRTPWTLSSDYVWDKTHRLGSKLYYIAAAVSLLSLAFQKAVFFIVVFAIVAASIIPVIYSYFLFKKKR